MPVILGCIADDFTGATDLANTLVKSGLRAVQLLGVPTTATPAPDAEAVVVALKSRTAPAGEAVRDSLAALDWLRGHGARQVFFKYCSTFDSTAEGNIGPVAEALLERLGGDLTIACPAFPENGRTVYQGHLFVFDRLLSESSMRDHPLTPMGDPDLVRILGRQTRLPVGLVPFRTVDAGPAAIRAAFDDLRAERVRIAIVDALTDTHLVAIGTACADLALLTGGSGVAMGLGDNYRRQGLDMPAAADALPAMSGSTAIISGSCSQATLGQIAAVETRYPVFRIDPVALAEGRDQAAEALDWAEPRLGAVPVLIAASAPPEAVRAAQERLGRMQAGDLVEHALAAVAKGLVERGVRRLVIAGGETSGAVLGSLGIAALRIGPEIAPGVPATVSLGEPPLALALKSGNFGGPDFFVDAFEVMP